MSNNNQQHVTIVMVEDDEGHARLIEKNLRRAGIMNELVHLDTGSKALDYFFKSSNELITQSLPLLILLDLNLPEVDGFEILKRLKADDRTKHVPIIVLTTTDNPKEIQRCYDLGCNVYIIKPVEYDSFADSIRKLGLLLAVVRVPEPGEAHP